MSNKRNTEHDAKIIQMFHEHRDFFFYERTPYVAKMAITNIDIEKVVDMYCTCKTPKLRQQLIAGIRQIGGRDMIEIAMSK